MKPRPLSLVVCLACSLAGFTASSSVALAEVASSAGGSSLAATGAETAPATSSGTSAGPLSSSLVTSGSPLESEQMAAEEQAKSTNPEAIKAREESRTEFEGLNVEQAAKLAREVFPGVITEPAGGPPRLPAGAQITGYLSDDAASVNLGGGSQAVLESMEPIAVQTSPGQRTPINLALSRCRECVPAHDPGRGRVDPQAVERWRADAGYRRVAHTRR